MAASVWFRFIFHSAEFSVESADGSASDSPKLTSRGLQSRKVFLDFLQLLCLWFPADRLGAGEVSLRVAAQSFWSKGIRVAREKSASMMKAARDSDDGAGGTASRNVGHGGDGHSAHAGHSGRHTGTGKSGGSNTTGRDNYDSGSGGGGGGGEHEGAADSSDNNGGATKNGTGSDSGVSIDGVASKSKSHGKKLKGHSKTEARRKSEPQLTGRRLWWSSEEEEKAECRNSFCALRSLLAEHWDELTETVKGKNAVKLKVSELKRRWRFCHRPWESWQVGQWHLCRGTFMATRQLPCGIWHLLHSLVAHYAVSTEKQNQAEVQLSASSLTTAVRNFLVEFMDCKICVRHLLRAPFDAAGLRKGRDAVMWLWKTHNFISRMILEEPSIEHAFLPDPVIVPTHSWPPMSICPSCSSESFTSTTSHVFAPKAFDYEPRVETIFHGASVAMSWNMSAVYQFLINFYGPKDAAGSPQEERSAEVQSAFDEQSEINLDEMDGLEARDLGSASSWSLSSRTVSAIVTVVGFIAMVFVSVWILPAAGIVSKVCSRLPAMLRRESATDIVDYGEADELQGLLQS
eukprot:TRINITY_DN4514_c0_g4_i1.p1 TRINITY_DN4514_c0_g4~~TRINITY_DN4514_c0_g4_i1.p1  ORF type:complete len:613 (-),score=120.56 TRINITY_DN4514_c0_g4_i1:334-2055(-)